MKTGQSVTTDRYAVTFCDATWVITAKRLADGQTGTHNYGTSHGHDVYKHMKACTEAGDDAVNRMVDILFPELEAGG